jgi:hypothetical protein
LLVLPSLLILVRFLHWRDRKLSKNENAKFCQLHIKLFSIDVIFLNRLAEDSANSLVLKVIFSSNIYLLASIFLRGDLVPYSLTIGSLLRTPWMVTLAGKITAQLLNLIHLQIFSCSL